MAEVFLARQSGMDGFEKPVVIKRILPQLSGEPSFVEMFLNEARVAARLSHPSIVHVFDFGKVDDQYYIAMEFIHGEDLRAIAKAAEKHDKRPSMAAVARIIADMLGALHYAHTRVGSDGKRLGLVHRDISPQNVLVTYEGGVKLVDFGIAKATESQAGQQTQAGMLKGKYAYMSPEQCRGKPLDARSDVFAVGILLWELLSWKRLFKRESDLATLVAVADEAIPPLVAVRNDVPPELDRICNRALARNVDDRYPSAQAMQSDLEALIRTSGWEADSIKLMNWLRDLFADKLHQQDEAIRAAGLGSIEDFLVHVEEGTAMAWIEPPLPSGKTPSGLQLPSADLMEQLGPDQPTLRPGAQFSDVTAAPEWRDPPPARAPEPPHPTPARTAPVASWTRDQPGGAHSDNTPSTLRHAVGQMVPRHEAVPAPLPAVDPSLQHTLPPSPWRRAAVIGSTAIVVSTLALGAIYWPARAANPTPLAATVTAPSLPPAEEAKIHVILDAPGVILIDGVAQPPGKEAEVTVSARVEHELRVKIGDTDKKKLMVPAQDPGAVKVVRLHVGE